MDDNSNEVVISVRGPRWLSAAIEKAAAKDLMSKSDYVRREVLKGLRADGVKLEPAE
jgi:hypothetical protein